MGYLLVLLITENVKEPCDMMHRVSLYDCIDTSFMLTVGGKLRISLTDVLNVVLNCLKNMYKTETKN